MAGSTVARAKVILEADDRGLKRGLSSAEKSFKSTTGGINKNLDDLEKKNSKVGKALGASLKAGAIIGGAALAGLAVGAKKAFDELVEGQKVAAETKAILKATGGVANVTAKDIDRLSSSLLKKTGIDDEQIKSGANMLLTFKNVRNEVGKGNDIFSQSTKVLADMSVKFGTDMPTSAVRLGKALNDPIKGISALSRIGVQFTEQQKKQIEAMVESGNVMGAQKVILAELKGEFGGVAEAAGSTLAGRFNVLKETAKNMGADLLGFLVPALTKVANGLTDALPHIQSFVSGLIQKLKPAIGEVVAFVERQWPTIQRVIGQVAQTLEKIFKQVGPPLLQMFRDLATIVVRTFTQIGQILADHQKDLETIARVVGVTLVSAWKSWREAMEPTLRVAVQLLGPLIAGLARVLAAINALLRPIGGLQTAFRIMIMATIGLIPNLILHWDKVVGVLTRIRDTITGGITRAVNGLRTVFANVTGFVLGLLSKMLGALGSITGALAKAAGWVPKVGGAFKDANAAVQTAKRSVDNLRQGIEKIKPDKKARVTVSLKFATDAGSGPGGGDGKPSAARPIPDPINFDKTVDQEMQKFVQKAWQSGLIPFGVSPPGKMGTGTWSDLSPSLWDDARLAQAYGLSVGSTYRAGATVRGSGSKSDHSYYPSKAFDAGFHSNAGWNDPNMRGFAMAVSRRPGIDTVILSPYFYKGGSGPMRINTPETLADHYDHVHVDTYHTGGPVPSRSGGRGDNVMALLEEGEYVMRRDAVKSLGRPFLDRLNQYKAGGDVSQGPVSPTSPATVDPYMTLKKRYPGWTEQQVQDWLVQFGDDPNQWPNPGSYTWDIEYGWIAIGTNRATIRGEPLHPIDKTVPDTGGGGGGVGTNPPGAGTPGDAPPDGTEDDPVNVNITNPQDVREAFDKLKNPIPTEEQGPCPAELAAQLAFQNRRSYSSNVFGSGAEAIGTFGHLTGDSLGISRASPSSKPPVTINNYFAQPPDDQFAFIKRSRWQMKAALG